MDLSYALQLESHIDIHDPALDSSLMMGYAGLGLFYYTLCKHTQIPSFRQKYNFCLDKVFDGLKNKIFRFDFKQGISGILWFLKYLERQGEFELDSEEWTVFSQAMRKACRQAFAENNWEYLRGGTGCLMVVREEQDYAFLIDYLNQKIKEKEGLYYLPSSFYPQTNIGLPFGVAGTLRFLREAARFPALRSTAETVRNKILSILLKSRFQEENQNYIPALAYQKAPCRMAWCYGELTIAYQLMYIAREDGNTSLQQKARQIAIDALQRDTPEKAVVYDACLQHGSSGNHLLYKQLYKLYPHDTFKEAGLLWDNYTRSLLKSNHYKFQNRYTKAWTNNNTLLEGMPGTTLTYLDDPDWTEIFLLK